MAVPGRAPLQKGQAGIYAPVEIRRQCLLPRVRRREVDGEIQERAVELLAKVGETGLQDELKLLRDARLCIGIRWTLG